MKPPEPPLQIKPHPAYLHQVIIGDLTANLEEAETYAVDVTDLEIRGRILEAVDMQRQRAARMPFIGVSLSSTET